MLEPTDIQRFVRLFARPNGDDGCWVWIGDVSNKAPYGRFRVKREGSNRRHRVLAHRFAYERFVGPIPGGWDTTVHHTCYMVRCVNPAHLEIMTRSKNASHRAGTHCRKGHEFTEDNIYMHSPGGRRPPARKCRTCAKLRAKRRASRPTLLAG